jgi:hypothetical protein
VPRRAFGALIQDITSIGNTKDTNNSKNNEEDGSSGMLILLVWFEG